MPEELRFLLRSAGYSILVGAIYWLRSAEAAGTILLVGVGIAAGVMFGAMYLAWRGDGNRLCGPPWMWPLLPATDAASGTTDESGRLPRSTLAPLTTALGLAMLALALVFGIWFALASLLPIVVGLHGWTRDAMAEYDAVAED